MGYMAPEVLLNKEYKGAQEDLFSAAVILFIMLTQHPPFKKADPNDEHYKNIMKGEWDEFWERHSDKNLSEEFMHLFTRLACFNPSERLTIEEIKNHEWFKIFF